MDYGDYYWGLSRDYYRVHSKHQTVLADGLRVYCRVAMALRFWKSWRSCIGMPEGFVGI